MLIKINQKLKMLCFKAMHPWAKYYKERGNETWLIYGHARNGIMGWRYMVQPLTEDQIRANLPEYKLEKNIQEEIDKAGLGIIERMKTYSEVER